MSLAQAEQGEWGEPEAGGNSWEWGDLWEWDEISGAVMRIHEAGIGSVGLGWEFVGLEKG